MPKVLVTLSQELIVRLDAVAPRRGSRSAEIERRLVLSFGAEELLRRRPELHLTRQGDKT